MTEEVAAPPETLALESHDCAACGAPAEWHPDEQALVCPFCGTHAPFAPDEESGQVAEIDLVRTLRELPADRRGWQGETKTVRCRSCDAISVFEAGKAGQNCEFCGSPQLIDYEEVKPPIRPTGVLPFKVSATKVRDAMRRWFGSKWLAPSRFKKKALIDTVKGIYIPLWTFDAKVHCPWTAQSGTYYYVTQSYRDSKGRTRTRQVRKTRWRPAAGVVDHFFDDEPVPGTRGLDRELLDRIVDYPTGEAEHYDRSFLAGFTVEHYQVVLIDAAKQSREQMTAKLRGLCIAQIPGDTHRGLAIDPNWSGETFKHVLAPVWLLAYDFHGKAYQVLVNGVTGAIAGRYPKSWWKIALMVLAGVIVAGALIQLLRSA